ncbi:hypothetical protein B0T13DRAFT_313471 [Neurospora crassa]|nr:hypothetical protein B0T13DRAFT_313471 [Neurospora crassa]
MGQLSYQSAPCLIIIKVSQRCTETEESSAGLALLGLTITFHRPVPRQLLGLILARPVPIKGGMKKPREGRRIRSSALNFSLVRSEWVLVALRPHRSFIDALVPPSL